MPGDDTLSTGAQLAVLLERTTDLRRDVADLRGELAGGYVRVEAYLALDNSVTHLRSEFEAHEKGHDAHRQWTATQAVAIFLGLGAIAANLAVLFGH